MQEQGPLLPPCQSRTCDCPCSGRGLTANHCHAVIQASSGGQCIVLTLPLVSSKTQARMHSSVNVSGPVEFATLTFGQIRRKAGKRLLYMS